MGDSCPKSSDARILVLSSLPSQSHCSPWCEWALQFSSEKASELKFKCDSSDSFILSTLLPSGVNRADTLMFAIVRGASFLWLPRESSLCHPSCVCASAHVCSGFLWTGSVPYKKFSFLFSPCHPPGLNPPVTKHYGGEGNSNEGNIRLGAQYRWTVLPYVLYLAVPVVLFIMPSVYNPCISQLAPWGQCVRWCEWRICEVVWMGLS